ncbi:MAG TPA: demethoxyubiquinone hydroxylase family protein [Holophagaceae bacterium]|nr:demethoxyubiquinone hydroxylase family protein [Holophagaceae bacterium]
MAQMQSPPDRSAESSLVSILQRAYSGELAAALAYRGHGISLKHDREIEEIQQIEREEWHHRRRLGLMLTDLGAKPRPALDAFQALVGVVILIGCNLVGWFIPMYFAGRLESQNDREYEEAALLAEALGLLALRDELRAFAQLERDHEAYFLNKVTGHPALPFWRRLFGWGSGRP